MENKFSETTIDEICGIQAEIEDLVKKCGPAMTSSESVNHNVLKIAGQLLAAMDKILNMGRDLNAITSCMLDVADSAEADNRDLAHGRTLSPGPAGRVISHRTFSMQSTAYSAPFAI